MKLLKKLLLTLTIGLFTTDSLLMINILPESKGSIFCIKVSGKLTDAEYKNFMPQIESVIQEFGNIKIYIDILDLDGWEWRVAWDDLAFGIKHWKSFSKIALVGERRWEQLSAKIANRITKADVQYFARENSMEALVWIQD